MKDASAGTNDAPQPAKSDQLTGISERKLTANRENAKKSTGPKTASGKTFSRRNAVKHGLCVNRMAEFDVLREVSKQYQRLLKDFWDQYQPVGRGEEVEVERIALCYWRFKRAWCYENVVKYKNAREADVGRYTIPDADELDRILRYESAVDRYLNRAIERLDRLQRRRKGEFDPPALNLHLA